MQAFNPKRASQEEIAARAALLPGRTLKDIGREVPAVEAALGKAPAKSDVGYAIEAYFGIPPNSSSLPDFESAGWELKTVPMLRVGTSWRVKERTVISLINYMDIVGENWDSSSVRRKLRCLLVFVEVHPVRSRETYRVLDYLLWEPTPGQEAYLKADWTRVRDKVAAGDAHELSESDGRLMGPCTKAATSASRRRQPFSSVTAKPRAFALKPAFMREIFETRHRPVAMTSDLRATSFEEDVLERLRPFVGCSIGEVASALGVKGGRGKDFGARVVRTALGAKRGGSLPPEFTMIGLTPRSPRVDETLLPYESISFPAFSHAELLDETWEDSDLLSRVEYMLFVPRVASRKADSVAAGRIGEPVLWRPRAETIDTLRTEWERARDAIRRGDVLSPLKESETVALHIRPHGRDGDDVTETPSGARVVKKGFWLNRSFVQGILTGLR